MAQEITINIKFEGNDQNQQQDIFKLPPYTSWQDLQAMLKAQFDCDAVSVFYIDTDGDFISVNSNEELKEAFQMATKCRNTLVLRVRDTSPETAVWTIDSSPKMSGPDALPDIQPSDRRNEDPVPQPEIFQQPDILKTSEHILFPTDEIQDDSALFNGGIMAEGKVAMDTKIDNATGETILHNEEKLEESDNTETGNPEVQKIEIKRDEETGTAQPKIPMSVVVKQKVKRKDKRTEEKQDSRRLTQSADRSSKSIRNMCDSESGEASYDEDPMPYSVFVKFMQQLKTDLRQEIVKDVTRKTVKQVLKGLDGAVIHSLQGKPIIPPVLDESSTDSKDPTSSHPIYYHEGIVCDFCERSVVGVRYKCCNCANYDLCEECEAIHGVHDSDHVFIKLRKPARLGKRTVILKNTLYKVKQALDPNKKDDQNDLNRPSDMPGPLEDFIKTKMERLQERTARKQEKLRKREEKIVEKQRKKEEKLKRRLECHRDHPTKREKLDLPPPCKTGNKEYDASFVCDVTVPDGTCVQPETKLQKTWKLKNTGLKPWTANTKLRLVYGTIPTPSNDIDVPEVGPDQECDVTVELQAPELPGRYQSHWKMYNDGVHFGHRVWCEIQVEPKEVLEAVKEDSLKFVKTEELPIIKEEKTDEAENKTSMENVPILLPESVKVPDQPAELIERSTSVTEEVPKEASPPLEESLKQDEIEKDLSSAVAQLKLDSTSEERGQDLMSFEMVDYTQRMTPKISQTATPTNTPLDISPPKSPAPELDNKVLSSSSSVELVNAEHEDEEQHQINPLLVEEFMNKFQVPTPVDDDIESISTISDDSSLSEDDDFLIVPLPACFDFSKPMTRSTIINEAQSDDNDVDDNHNNMPSAYSGQPEEGHQSVDEILTTSGTLATPTLSPGQNTDIQVDNTNENEDMNKGEASSVDALAAELNENLLQEVHATASEVPVMTTNSVEVPPTPAVGAAGEIDNDELNAVSNDTGDITEIKEPIDYDDYSEQAAGYAGGVPDNVVIERSDAKGATGHDQRNGEHSPGEFVNQIMSTAVSAANKAAANAYTTCKEVFYTWQARTYQNGSGKFTPPQSGWKPKEEKWTPKESTFVPPKSEWTPPKDTWKPPTQGIPNLSSTLSSKSPMGKLVEMGFCNRELNKELLKKHNDDVEAVVQDLLSSTDNDWWHRRH